MSAIYHILKNGITVAVTTMGNASDTGYFTGDEAYKKQVDKGNPGLGTPLPLGNWRGLGTKVSHIGSGRKG